MLHSRAVKSPAAILRTPTVNSFQNTSWATSSAKSLPVSTKPESPLLEPSVCLSFGPSAKTVFEKIIVPETLVALLSEDVYSKQTEEVN